MKIAKEISRPDEAFKVRFQRANGHQGEVIVSRQDLRKTIFGIISTGGKIISNKFVTFNNK